MASQALGKVMQPPPPPHTHPGQRRQGMAKLGFEAIGTGPARSHSHHSPRLRGSSEDSPSRQKARECLEKPRMQIKGSMRREACLLSTYAGTHVHTHARKAVPVTSFLGDSVQLVSHTSESPREQGEAGEKTVRQARGPLKSGCRHQGSGRPGRKAGEGRE